MQKICILQVYSIANYLVGIIYIYILVHEKGANYMIKLSNASSLFTIFWENF